MWNPAMGIFSLYWWYFYHLDWGIKELRKFLQAFNNFHPSIKLDWKYTGKETPQVEFLDVTLSIKGLNISYDLYCKPTDCHQYLHYQSCHPHHTKSSSVYSQVLRISKRCNSKEKLDNHISSLKNWFLDRGYPEDLIRSQTMKAIEEIDRRENLSLEGISQNADSNSKETGVVFVATYHPALTKINRILVWHVRGGPKVLKCSEVFKYYISRLKIKKGLMQYLNISEVRYGSGIRCALSPDAKPLPQWFW